jgi:steroid delta-isomerase-like uncharacterized protein
MRKLCLACLAMGMFACGGGDATTPPPQAPAAPPPAAPAPAPVAATDMPAPVDATPAPSKSDKMLAAMKSLGDGMTAHDAAKVASLYAPDAVVKTVGMPDVTGREAIQGNMTQMFGSAPDSKGGARRIWVKDGLAVLEWTSSGTNTGPGPWGKPTGKAYGFNGASVFWFNDDGLVKEEHVYFDAPTMMEQIGMGSKGMPKHPVLSPPSGAPEVHVAKADPSPTVDANVASAKALNRTFEKGDSKAFLDALSDDVAYEDASMPAPMTGKKAAKTFFEAFAKAFPGPKVTESNLVGIDDFTIDEYVTDATQKAPLSMGPGMTIPNTKKTMSVHTLEILQWKDGKMVHGWAYDNGMEMASQLGLIPQPKAPKGDMKGDAPKPDATKKADAKSTK